MHVIVAFLQLHVTSWFRRNVMQIEKKVQVLRGIPNTQLPSWGELFNLRVLLPVFGCLLTITHVLPALLSYHKHPQNKPTCWHTPLPTILICKVNRGSHPPGGVCFSLDSASIHYSLIRGNDGKIKIGKKQWRSLNIL